MGHDFVSCLLCDIQHGMPTPGGILIDNDLFFAVHTPPPLCARHVIVLGTKRHVRSVDGLWQHELLQVMDVLEVVERALERASGLPSRFEACAGRFGHLAWLAWSEDGDPRPIAERLAPEPEGVVRVWVDELDGVFDEARIETAGGHLPAPPRLPGDVERATVRAARGSFCTKCGAKLAPRDYGRNRCHGCGAPVVE